MHHYTLYTTPEKFPIVGSSVLVLRFCTTLTYQLHTFGTVSKLLY